MDTTLTRVPDTPLSDRTEALLYGADPTTRIVAVEPDGSNRMAIVRRGDEGTLAIERDEFRPWLLAARAEPWAALRSQPTVTPLSGDHPLRFLVNFSTWSAFTDAVQAARDANERFFRLRSPVEQYLVQRSRTLFKGMDFDHLRRLQLDLETTGLDPANPDSQVILAVLMLSGAEPEVLALETTEAALLEQLTERIRALDPDVIEGHNLYNFDIPFLVARANRANVPLRWGRDGSTIRIGSGLQRFKAGPLALPFTPCYVYGRHVIDTYQQIQRYDSAGRLSSYGLKNAVEELGLTRPGREFIPGEEIEAAWRTDRDRLIRYAIDDVRDVDTLSCLATPTEFYQTQLVPRSFQSVATGGPGEKINDLMLRAYLTAGHSVPTAQAARDYPGGHAELLAVGAFAPVVKCDVESLYPSVMLSEGVTSSTDTLGAYLPMLADLTRRRLDAKARSRASSGRERAVWEGLQSSFKVLINSFYGYLGYSGALFNDFAAAERVTLAGQRIIKGVVAELRASGAQPIEVDTDGVYFVPPPAVASERDELAFVDRLGESLPAGIRLAHDGRYAGMLSLRLKTYGLLEHDGTMILKGSALRSRRMERCFRQFIRDAARFFLMNDRESARDAYFALATMIRERSVPLAEFSQWGMLSEQGLTKQPRFKRLIERLPNHVRAGERIEFYERQDGELALVAEYASDESVTYLLRRLRDVAERFRALFPTDAEFDAFFPAISARTDLAAAKEQPAAHQLTMFG
jgi:DNA polymerase elongation subunit (family B)